MLLFVGGLNSKPCVKLLAKAGVNLDHCDQSGSLTVLHMAVGYVRPDMVKVFLNLNAYLEVADDHRRTMQFGHRIVLEGVIKVLEGEVIEYAEVQEILERRGKGENLEYLVRWKDGLC